MTDDTLFRGLIAYPITPADPDGVVDAGGLARLLARLAEAEEIGAVGLLGSTGGYAYLSRRERARAVSAAAETLGGRLPLIVGVGALRTDEAVALARDAAAGGARGLLLAPVSYTPLTDDEVLRHFEAVAGATELPLCIYDNPGTTHFRFTPALLARIAALSNVRAVKTPPPSPGEAGATLETLRAALPGDIAIGCSGDWAASECLRAGYDAWHGVAAGLLPGPAGALARAAQASDTREAARLDALLQPLWALLRAHGGIRVMHAAAQHLCLTEHDPPRPILPMPHAAQAPLAEALAPLGHHT